MLMNRALLILSLILALPVFANGNTVQRGGAIGSDAPAGKPYVYKQSAGEPRVVLVGRGKENFHLGFFNREPFRAAPLLAADRFLVRFGLLNGEPTRNFNPIIQ